MNDQVECPVCMGEGVIHHHLLLSATCPRCDGTGVITYASLKNEPVQEPALIYHTKTVAELLADKTPLGHPTTVSLLKNRHHIHHHRPH